MAPALAFLCLVILAAVANALTPGDLDPTFASDGTFNEPLGTGTRPGANLYAVAVQPDGKIVTAGTATSSSPGSWDVVARVLPNGALDPTFASGGKLLDQFGTPANEGFFPAAIAIQPDGKIVVAGTVSNFTTQVSRAVVVRLTPEGAFDNTLDGDGILITQLGEGGNPDTNIFAVAVLPDGRILIGGSGTDSAGKGNVLLARRNVDGSPDPSFGTGGKKLMQLGIGANANSSAIDLVLQPDGKIVIAGPATDVDYVQPDAAAVARFDADGQALDPSFGTGGKYLGRFGATNRQFSISALAIGADGKPVLAGNTYDNSMGFPSSEAMVARLNVDGAGVDSGFGTNGIFHQTFEGAAGDARLLDVVVQPDGKIVAVGNGEAAGFTVLILRLTPGGALDPLFSGDGRDLTQLGQSSSAFGSVALDAGGGILAAGQTLDNVNGNLDTHPLLARYVADLPPIASFTATPNPVDPGQAVAFDGSASTDSDGTIVSREWDFGDGSTATGATASHSYASPGTYQAKLTVRDDYGVTNSSTQAIGVNTPPGTGAIGTPTGAPVLTGLSLKPTKFPAAPRGGSVARRTGTKVTYTDSQAATTTFTVARVLPGRKRGKRCVKPTSRNRSAKRCTRFVRVRGSFTRVDVAGKNTFRFTGRLRRKALKPGRYRLSARPRMGGKAGKTFSVRFRIVR